MYCVKSPKSIEDTIKKSRFIGFIWPCDNEADIFKALTKLQLEHPNASHIAYAFRLKTPGGTVSRFHDAGEPSGTAGKPIYQYLEGRDILNTLIAVVRYFGGIKLGTGGLARAYGSTARKVIEVSELYPLIEFQDIQMEIDYSQFDTLEHQLKKLDGKIKAQDFSERIKLIVRLPGEHVAKLVSRFDENRKDVE